MSETGGPVFEGSSARPEKKRPRIVERVKQRIDAFRAGVQKEVDARKSFGQEIEARTVERYATVVGSMNESMLKSAYKKLEPVVRLQAKARGITAGVVDNSLGVAFRVLTKGLSAFAGFKILDAGFSYPLGWKKPAAEALGAGVAAYGADVAARRTDGVRPMEKVLRIHENVKDYVGKKQVDILNKIIGRKPQMA